jgi:hypothetical protein
MPLGREAQLDFSAGEQRDVAPHLIDPRGFFAGENALLLDDGSAFKRGGSVAVSSAPFGSALRYVWDGWLQPGRRTFIASTSAYGTIAADGKTPVTLGLGGYPSVPKTARAIQGMLFIPGGKIWGGSRKTAEYNTGSITATNGSRTVVGVGTKWLASVDVGMLFRLAEGGQRVYVISAVRSDTEIELRDVYEATTKAGVAYTLKPLEDATAPYKTADLIAVSGRRLIVCVGDEFLFSEPDKPHLWEAKIPPSETVVQNRHVLGEGVQTIGVESIGVDRALVFHTGGVTVVSNLSVPIVDGLGADQHRLDLFSRDTVLWGPAGITGYSGSLVVPATDDVYLMDGTSSPVHLSESIAPLYRNHILEGHVPGAAWIDRDHYFLPVLDSSGVPVDLLCCRLDRPYRSRGRQLFPWTFHSGSGAKVSAGVRRDPAVPGEIPAVYAACGDGRLLDVSFYFRPSAAVKNDHDGTTANFALVTRDYEAGNLAIARFRRLDLYYELIADVEEDPLITAEIGTGIRKRGIPTWNDVKWDEFEWAAGEELEFDLLGGMAVPNFGPAAALAQNAWTWRSNTQARYARFRIQCADPVAKLTIRGVAVFVAKPGGVRRQKVA